MIRGRAGSHRGARAKSPLGGLSRDRCSPGARSPALAQPTSEMPQSSSLGLREEAGPREEGGGEGSECASKRASEPGQEGGERAGRRAGALASRAQGSPLLSGPAPPFLRAAHPLTAAPGEPGRRPSPPRAAIPLPGATKGGSGGEASAETPGLRAPQPHVEPSSARPPLKGSRARVALGAGLPASGLVGFRGTGVLGGLPLPPAPPETLGGDPNTPALLHADSRQHPGTQPPAGKHVHANTYTACAAGPGCAPPPPRGGGLGVFWNGFTSPFRSLFYLNPGSPGVPPECVLECRAENGDPDRRRAASYWALGLPPRSRCPHLPGRGRAGRGRYVLFVSSPGIPLISPGTGALISPEVGGEFVKQTVIRPHPRGEVTVPVQVGWGASARVEGREVTHESDLSRNGYLLPQAGPCLGQRSPQTRISRFWGGQ